MRIGFYVGEIQPDTVGGGNTFQTNIINALKNYETKHELFFYYISAEDVYSDTDNIKFINLNCPKGIIKLKNKIRKKKKIMPRKLNDAIFEDKISLVYFISYIHEKIELPFISTIWDLAHREHPYFPEVSVAGWGFERRDELYNYIIPRAARVVVGNNEGKRQICQYYNVKESLVETIPMPTPDYVYNIDADNSILQKLSIEPCKYLYYPAQFWPHKNHIRLIKELKKIKDCGYDLKLVFTGSDKGNKEYVEQCVNNLGLEKDVIFAGFVKREELISLYKNAFALCYASYFDPDNLPPLEAMALNTPVICSDTKGMKEQLRDCALFFNPKTGENFKENIDKLYNEVFKQEILKKGHELVNEYSTKNYIKRMFEIIDDFSNIRECWSSENKFIHL